VQIRLIVFPRFQMGARTEVRPVSRAEALIGLARNSFNFGAFGGSGLRVLADVVQGASAFALTMDDLVEATGVVEDLLSSARS
jgi:ribosomal protein L10